MAKKSTASASANTPDLIVSQPISLLEREIKADIGGLFKSLGLAAAHIGTKKYYDLAADLGSALSALSLRPDAGGLAWLLIRRSLLRAMQSLTEESWLHRSQEKTPEATALEGELDAALGRAQLTVNKDFFRQPGSLSLLPECVEWFRKWLLQVGFDQPKAASISTRLRSYFVYALNQVWRAHADIYEPIIVASTTPFTQAGERERAWEQYRAWLDQELDQPMFGEPFSLRQLYIPLRAYYERLPQGQTDLSHVRSEDKDRKRIALNFTDHLLTWVLAKDKNDACRVISGGPGSGKSSVAKMFTAEVLAQTGWRALYIPLHQIKYKGEIIPAIHQYLTDTGLLPGASTPLDRDAGEPQLLLIFDGLDELAMLGKIDQTNTQEFVRAVKDLVRDHNTTALRLKVILTGRTVVMQSLESEFRAEGSVLHLCPYQILEGEKGRYERGWKLLAQTDQRQLWWRKYGELTGQGYSGLPESLDRPDLLEVSAEPLLNYLLALAYQSGGLDFTKQVTQNQIYAKLIQEVYERRWAGGENFAVRGMVESDFQRVLEEIAVASWHGDGRKTTVKEVTQHCADARITPLLEIFQDGAENGVLRLFTAFFFRKAGDRDQDNSFEFTHKSFGEYLVARRMIRLLGDMQEELQRHEKTYRGWTPQQCLEEWARLCGPTAMTWRQWEFLKGEMCRERAQTLQWQKLLEKLISFMLKHGMPMKALDLPDYKSMLVQARNAEESMLMTLNATALQNKERSNIDWPDSGAAGGWLMQLQGQRIDRKNSLAHFGLSWMNYDSQMLHMRDFYHSSLDDSSFANAGCYQAMFEYSTITRVDLRGGTFSKSNFENARLIHCNFNDALLLEIWFENAAIIEVDFARAKLTDARFVKAEIHNASFVGADLQRAVFDGASLTRVIFDGAFLEDAKLEDLDLAESSFQKAHLVRVNLERANLQRANFRGASLNIANLRQTKLMAADLEGAVLVSADLQWADLSGANLQGADLENANLQFATLAGANLTGAKICKAVLQSCNLEGVIGLPEDWQKQVFYNPNGGTIIRRRIKTGGNS